MRFPASLHHRKLIPIEEGDLKEAIGVLAVFKYFNVLNGNMAALAHLLHWNYSVANLGMLLPIGLSFHTFQAMSYTIEVFLLRTENSLHSKCLNRTGVKQSSGPLWHENWRIFVRRYLLLFYSR